VTNQITNIHAAEPTSLAMAAVTKKIPEPIMEPATKLVASNNPNERFKWCFSCDIFWFLVG
jgi:hypothetical protein